MPKLLTITVIVLALVISALAGTFASANPWMGIDWIAPREDTKPPVITIVSTQKSTENDEITVSLNAVVEESKNASYTRLMKVYYKTDWQQNETALYNNEGRYLPYDPYAITEFSYNLSLTGVPEGKHTIIVYAEEWGAYIDGLFVSMFSINSSAEYKIANDTFDNTLVLTPNNGTIELDVVVIAVFATVAIAVITLLFLRKLLLTGWLVLHSLRQGGLRYRLYPARNTKKC